MGFDIIVSSVKVLASRGLQKWLCLTQPYSIRPIAGQSPFSRLDLSPRKIYFRNGQTCQTKRKREQKERKTAVCNEEDEEEIFMLLEQKSTAAYGSAVLEKLNIF